MNLRPWREVAIPHEDVLKGTFQQAEFAADLSRVHDRRATAEYQDPVLFFQRTFITEGMRLLLDSVVKRLTGRGGDPVIQLQTSFGGGKTHTMLGVYHIAQGEAPLSDLPGISPILNAAGVIELPKANIAVLDGNKLAPNMPQKRKSLSVRTLWGELAYQLGGEAGYELVKDADASGTSPGKEVLAQLLNQYAPCVILMDELVAYIRQFEEGKTLSGGTYDSNLSFVQALTEALKAVPNAVLLASLPESDKEAGSTRGIKALETLSHYFARVQALWKPVAVEEAFEIVRRRLFSKVQDRTACEAVCRAYADLYSTSSSDMPRETQESRYYERLIQAYPIHPEVFDRLYEDWSSLDNFQRTRGVLKLMAKVIHRLWKDGNNDLMIMPGSLPLYDADTRNEAIYYLPAGWDPVLDRDIDGDRAETTEIENRDTRLGSLQSCRRAARTIFLGSAPTTPNQMVRGLETERVVLGCVQPGQQVGLFKDALNRLTDRLHYLNCGNNRFWFDTRPNLRREMEERKRRFQDKDDVYPVVRDLLRSGISHGPFGGVHVFTPSSDVPDDFSLRLVVLSPDTPFSRKEERLWKRSVESILKSRGDQPRQKQNRLLFLLAEYDCVSRLKDQVKSMLAWQSIVNDYRENRIVLDNLMAKNAEAELARAKDGLHRMIRETYKWILAPLQEAVNGKGLSEIKWESFQLNPGAKVFIQEIERVLRENELLISEWAPIHLSSLLKRWYWKKDVEAKSAKDVWEDTCKYLYLPRLKDDQVFRSTLGSGATSKDFFAFAQGKDGEKYVGFSFGKTTAPIMDGSLLLMEPQAAFAYEEKLRLKEETEKQVKEPSDEKKKIEKGDPPVVVKDPEPHLDHTRKRRFFGTFHINPYQAKKQLTDITDEVLQVLTSRAGVSVKISLEVEAEFSEGFDEGVQRAIKENCNALKFNNFEFESGE